MVQLGEGMKTTSRSRDELVVHSELTAVVAAAVAQEAKRLEQLLRQLTKNPPTPLVNVAPPNVSVSNTVPKIEPAIVSVELEGIEDLCEEMCALRKDLAAFVKEMSKTTVRTVKRDTDGLITEITDRRI